MWKAPRAGWTGGAIVVMHGGGGSHTDLCVAKVALAEPQVRIAAMALGQGFAIFLLDSSDKVTDTQGRLCAKVWHDEVRPSENLDLPFIDDLLLRVIPALRPPGSRSEVFLTGLSSGACMTVRAASRFGDRVAGFAPVAGGDPYGWFRDCTRRPGDRANVAGAGFDDETRRQIIDPRACDAQSAPNEKPWDGAASSTQPPFRAFHHAEDGVNDRNCVDKARRQLTLRGYPESAPFTPTGGVRRQDVHFWQDDFNAPILAFFAAQGR